MFYKEVDKRKRQDMAVFLKDHFRYDTMSSWNRVTSFANNVKIYKLKLGELENKAYEAIQDELVYDICAYPIIADFTKKMKGRYTIGFNGRCGGYLVLYNSEYVKSEHLSYCRSCGQKNFQKVPEGEVGVCGRCGQKNRVNYNEIPMNLRVYSGRGIEFDEEDSIEVIKSLVEVVQEFDKACDEIIEAFTSYLESEEV